MNNTGQTVHEALDEKRERKGNPDLPAVTSLVLCKFELFYCPVTGNAPSDSVYPVSVESARKEAEFFGVPFYEE